MMMMMMMMARLRLKSNSSEQHTTSTYLQLLQHPMTQWKNKSINKALAKQHQLDIGSNQEKYALFIVSFHLLGMNFLSPMNINTVASEIDAFIRRARSLSLGSIQ
jgi:hypothetical protein